MSTLLAGFAFSHGGLERAVERRSDARWLAAARQDAAASVLVVREDGALLGRPGTLLRIAPQQLTEAERSATNLLGTDAGRGCFALGVGRARFDALAAEHDGSALDLRQLAASASPAEAGLAAFARALLHWQSRKRYCGRCGAATRIEAAGHRAECTDDGCAQQYFPRTDPAIITVVHRGTRCLLGRQSSWPERRYSTLAGFVEPGETLEQALRREVREESGIEVGMCRYVASQPWPFPASLMLGFEAEAHSEAITLGSDGELAEARWFEAEDLHTLTGTGELVLSPAISIAFHLIDVWQQRHTQRALTPGPNWTRR